MLNENNTFQDILKPYNVTVTSTIRFSSVNFDRNGFIKSAPEHGGRQSASIVSVAAGDVINQVRLLATPYVCMYVPRNQSYDRCIYNYNNGTV
jgi:hypothetical protein